MSREIICSPCKGMHTCIRQLLLRQQVPAHLLAQKSIKSSQFCGSESDTGLAQLTSGCLGLDALLSGGCGEKSMFKVFRVVGSSIP